MALPVTIDRAEKFLLELQGVVEELRRAEKEGN